MHKDSTHAAEQFLERLTQLFKPNGISVLISAQNEAATIEACVRSFVQFGDEVIIVTNDSTDETPEISRRLSSQYDSVIHIHANGLRDLYQNRAIGLNHVKFRWVFRGDGDYIAYTDEDEQRSIRQLRERIMSTAPIWPTVFYCRQINVTYRLNLTASAALPKRSGYMIPPCFGAHMPRVYLHSPLLKFKRLGRWEGVPYLKVYRKYYLDEPYWLHCTLKADRDFFLRSERTNWRELGEFKTYPSVESYVKRVVIPVKYPGSTVDEAAKSYIQQCVYPYLEKYDEASLWAYPKLARRLMSQRPDLVSGGWVNDSNGTKE